MTRQQRMLAAIRRQPIDSVPLATYNLHGCGGSAHAQDESYRDLLALVREKAGVYCKSGLRPAVGSTAGERLWEVTTDVAEDGDNRIETRVLHTPRGDLRSVSVKPKDQPAYTTESYVKTDDDIDRYLSLPWEPGDYDAGGLAELEEQVGDWGVVTVGYTDPMHSACRLFDFEDFTIRCLTQLPAVLRLVERLFERIAEDTRRRAVAARGHEVVFLTGGPEVTTPPLMPPHVFDALVVPFQKRLINIIHAEGHLAMIHCHGRVRHVLDAMIATGADAIEPIEPPPQGDIGIAELLERTDGRLAMMGHIQDQELHYVEAGTMARHVEDIARVVAGRTGYVMMPTCTPFQHPATPTWLRNYTEWIEAAARVFGAG